MSTKTKYLATVDTYFHVYNRGVSRLPVFFSAADYNDFLRRVRKQLERPSDTLNVIQAQSQPHNNGRVELVAYCLMPNHFHFILHQLAANAISDFMGHVCNGYVKAINLKMRRSGHLFEGKYKMKLIDDNSYLLHLSQYIHMNPVRARLVKRAEDWAFSSCRTYYGLATDSFISTEAILGNFSSREEYLAFVESYREEDKEDMEKYLTS